METQTITYKPLFGMKTVTKRDRSLVYVSEAAEQAMVAAQRLTETAQMAVSENGSIVLRDIYLYVELNSDRNACRYELRSLADDRTVGVYQFRWENPTGGLFFTPDHVHKLNLL